MNSAVTLDNLIRTWKEQGRTKVAVITAGFAFLGVYTSNRKQAALVAYRLGKLEAKVDQHNHVVERMYRLESRVESLQNELNELRR